MDINSLIKSYYTFFLKNNPIFGEYYIAKNNWIKNDIYYPKLNINIDRNIIQSFFENDNIIPLRKYNGEKSLILGCGNEPIFTCGGVYTHKIYKKHDSSDDRDPYYGYDYRNKHQHVDICTVNPSIGYNPTLVAHFGYQKLSFFNDKSFESIIFEGFMLEYDDFNIPKYTVSELIRLLKNYSTIYTNNDDKLIQKFIKKNNTLIDLNNRFILTENNVKEFCDIMWT